MFLKLLVLPLFGKVENYQVDPKKAIGYTVCMNNFLPFKHRLVAFALCMAVSTSVFTACAHAQEESQIEAKLKGIGIEAQANGVTSQSFRVAEKGRTIWSMSIPYKLYYAYDSASNEFVVSEVDDATVYAINLKERVEKVPQAIVEKVGAGITLLGYPTTQWRIFSLGALCGDVFTSPQAAENLGLNYADQTRIAQGVAEALSKPPLSNDKCENFVVKPALGKIMGYALAFSGRMGEGRISSINANADMPRQFVKPSDMAKAQVLTDSIRKELLLGMFPAHERGQIESLMQGKTAQETMKLLLILRDQKNAEKTAE